MNSTNSLEATSYTHAFPWTERKEYLYCSCVVSNWLWHVKVKAVLYLCYVLFAFFPVFFFSFFFEGFNFFFFLFYLLKSWQTLTSKEMELKELNVKLSQDIIHKIL